MKKVVAWILAIMMVFTMAGCATTAKTPAAEDETSASVAAAERKGTLRIATKQAYVTLGVPQATSQSPDWLMSAPAIESLARLDTEANVIPWLAKEFTLDEDAKTITVKLNEGISFHDGTPFNAEAVKKNYEIAKEYNCGFTGDVNNCEVISDYELVIHLNIVNGYTLSNVLADGGRMISPTFLEENGFDACVSMAVGTGPYKMEEPANDTSVKFVANDDYWIEGQPYMEGIEFLQCGDESTALTALQSGKAQAIMATTPADADLLSKDPRYMRAGGDNAYYSQGTQLIFETDNPESPMYDLRVRQAFCYALDREAIVRAESYGLRPAVQQLALTGVTASDKVVGYEYNPEKAKKLLADAGYPDGGCEITINYISSGEKLSVMMQEQLQEVGFVVNLNLLERAQWTQCVQIDTATPYEDVIFGFIGYAVAHMSTAFGPAATNYAGQWDKETLEKLNGYFSTMKDSMDSEEVKAATDAFQTLLIDEACFVCPLNAYTTLLYVETGVKDLGFFETNVNFWTPERAYIAE